MNATTRSNRAIFTGKFSLLDWTDDQTSLHPLESMPSSCRQALLVAGMVEVRIFHPLYTYRVTDPYQLTKNPNPRKRSKGRDLGSPDAAGNFIAPYPLSRSLFDAADRRTPLPTRSGQRGPKTGTRTALRRAASIFESWRLRYGLHPQRSDAGQTPIVPTGWR